MIKCPPTLKAGPYTFKVGLDKGDTENYGKANMVRKEMVFAVATLNATEPLCTLIHEWIHMYEHFTSNEGSENRMKHDQLTLVSCAVVDLLQQLGLDTALDISELPELRL